MAPRIQEATHEEEVAAEVHEEAAPPRPAEFLVVDVPRPGVRPKQLVAAHPTPSTQPTVIATRIPEGEASEHHRPQGVAASVRDERRCDHDRVHDRGREHERHRRGRQRGPSTPAAGRRGPSRTRRSATPPRRGPRPAAAAASATRGARAPIGTRTSIAAEAVAPSRMNGNAWTRSEPKMISRFRSQGRLDGSTTRTSTATARSPAVTIATGARKRRGGVPDDGARGRARQPSAVPREGDGERRVHVVEERRPARRRRPIESATCCPVSERSTSTSRSRKSPSAATSATTGAPSAASTSSARPGASSPWPPARVPVAVTTNVA